MVHRRECDGRHDERAGRTKQGMLHEGVARSRHHRLWHGAVWSGSIAESKEPGLNELSKLSASRRGVPQAGYFRRDSTSARRASRSAIALRSSGSFRKTADDFSQSRLLIAGYPEMNDPGSTELGMPVCAVAIVPFPILM